MKAEVNKDGIFIDGKPMRLLSGELHYFRVHPDQWEDRLLKLKACGLNTVATYIPWNLHEPRPGEFCFDGFADVVRFIALAGKLGLRVMVRPGPYICSEWEFGAFPAWLLNIPGLRLRCLNPSYMAAVKRYFDTLFARIGHLFCQHDGPVIAIQIENGYASYGNDIAYIEKLRDMVLATGFTGIIFTADGDSDTRISTATVEGVWKTLMLGENPEAGLAVLRAQQPDLPLMISEFWDGQGIRTGVPTRLRDARVIAADLERILASGAHVNLYMFHGGTNFGFMNGGLKWPQNDKYEPFVTSYDTDAPLNEAGDPTPKYFALRQVLAKYNSDFKPESTVPSASPKRAFGCVELTRCSSFIEQAEKLSTSVCRTPHTMTMEELGQDYGFILYRTRLQPQKFVLPLTVTDVRDRAWLFLNGKKIGAMQRNDHDFTVNVMVPEGGATLDILVENMGRYNFFWHMEDNRKGITCGVVLNQQQFQHDWEIFTLPLDDLSLLAYRPIGNAEKCPAFFAGSFQVDMPADTFLRVTPGKKGLCWINGFNLGRYDNQGPQFTLYVPAPLLKKGENRIEVLELDSMVMPLVDLVDEPQI